MAFHTVTRSESGNSRFINFITVADNLFSHRQIEERDGKVFMRLKRRSISET